MSFLDSIHKYRSIYFHFLDGLLNTEAGGTFDNVLRTLKEVAQINLNEIVFVNFEIIDLTYIMIFNEQYQFIFDYNNEERTRIPLELLKFCIFPMVFNKHQTTTIIFTKGIEMYLYILNTGLDMEVNGKPANINNQDLYQLTKGICLCKDITDENKLDNAYNMIKTFFFFSFFYKYVEDDMYKEKKKEGDVFYNFSDNFKNLLLCNYSLYSDEEKIFDLQDQAININELNDPEIIYGYYNYEFFFKMNTKYYLLVSYLIDNYPNKENIGKIVQLEDCEIDSLKIIEELNEKFLRKIILYNQEDNLYIYPQESGSCTWYSIYFSILLYYVINEINYSTFINEINSKFYDYIKNIYKKHNFEEQLLNNKNNYFYMKQLCSKLIDIKLIDNEILYEQSDIIYDINIGIEFTHSKKNYEVISELNNNTIIFSENNVELITNFFYKLTYLKQPEFYTFAFNIFTKKKNIFKECINIELILQTFQKYIVEKRLVDENDIVYKHLIIFNYTYSLTLSENIPSFITYFIPYILYLNNNINPQLELNFENGKNNLFECCILFFRLQIIGYIMYYIIEFTRDISVISQLYNLTIFELININGEKKFKIEQQNFNTFYRNFEEEKKKFDNYYVINDREKEDIYKIFIDEKKEKILHPTELFEYFNENFNNLIKIEEFLYENPEYITIEFLLYNIGRINQQQKIKLITFYCDKIHKFENTYLLNNDELFFKLYILLFNNPSRECSIKINFFFNIHYDLPLNLFRKIIFNLKEISFSDFLYKIINEKNIIFLDKFYIIPKYNYNKTTINEKEFRKIDINKEGFFARQTLLIQKYIIPEDSFEIYQIIDKYYIKYICIGRIINFKILKIYINDNEVLKFNSIIYPFKYLIPNTHLYFIYNKNGVYNITFNIDNLFFYDSILGKKQLKDGIYNFEINPNTQFFLNKNIENWDYLCSDTQLNSYNILYVNLDNKTTDSNGYSCSKERYQDIFNFNKNTIFNDKISYDLTNFKLLKNGKDILFRFFIDMDKIKELTESYKKLLFKISKCKINQLKKEKWICRIQQIKLNIESKITKFTNYIKNISLADLLDNYPILQSYLLNVKIYNFIDKLLFNINKEEIVCSLIKNYNILFDTKTIPYQYKFEILFELINGNEILKEQMDRYKIIIDSYNIYELSGGGNVPSSVNDSLKKKKILKYSDELKENMDSLINVKFEDIQVKKETLELCPDNFYQLHHFMMGKGKSAIITPLLSLYLSIIKKIENVYIIVPKHLVKQTEDTLNNYINIFQKNNIYIKSEDEIKKDFLDGNLKSKEIVFLIDEFDSLINPLKSNFNYIKKQIELIDINEISSLIKIIINDNINELDRHENITKEKLMTIIEQNRIIKNKNLLADNIITIIEQLNNNSLKYNIKWGIDSNKLYAIPFRSKDKPIENSSFTSCIMSVFLTYYYYIIIMKYNIDENIFNLLKYNKDCNKKLKKIIKLTDDQYDIESINTILKNESIKDEFFMILFQEIINKIKLSKYNYNTSFIDILNIDKIFKIGYSGTVNMNLPYLNSKYTFDRKCLYKDEDENNNIEYAILNSKIVPFNISEILINLNNFDALIDVCGYFYKYSNYNIALEIYNNFCFSRDVIFINEKDEKMVIVDNILEKLNENKIYNKPFLYYDQAHIVGIDIKQDNYPNLKGLCIIDNLSYYSEVAQAMFRLRKLNLGHSISFILNNFLVKNVSDLYQKIIKNEKDLILKQNDCMNLQALKSDIRKIRKNSDFIENYKEELFYYFNKDITDDNSVLKLIFNEDEIKIIDECYLEKYNLNFKILKKMLYNIDFNIQDSEIQHQVSSQENTESEIKIQNQSQIEKRKYYSKPDSINNFIKYKFKNFDFMKEIDDLSNYNKYTFKIDDLLSFLPNIFFGNFTSTISFLNYQYSSTNMKLIFVYIFKIQKFILIPIYMVTYLYDNFLMYDLNLNIINNKLSDKYRNIVKEDELENNIFVKIITNNYTQVELNTLKEYLEIDILNPQAKIDQNIISYYLSVFILYMILYNNFKENDIIERIFNSHKFKSSLEKILQTLDYTKIDDVIRKIVPIQKLTSFNKKYLKYKIKYLNLKKMLQ